MNEFDSPFWDWIRPHDTAAFRFFNANPPASFLADPLMRLLSDQYIWIGIGVLFVIYALVRKNRQFLLCALSIGIVICVTDLFCYQFLKPYFDRLRPCHTLNDVRLVASGCGGSWGYPSNHAANAMAIAVTIKSFFPTGYFWKISFTLAFLVGYSRIHLGVHYPFDVLSGFVFGTILAVITSKVLLVRIKAILSRK